MSDPADTGNDTADFLLNAALKAASVPPNVPKANGRCLYCEEPVEADARWCDVDCRDDWEKENARK